MKQLCFFFFFTISISAQQFTSVDQIVREYPRFNNAKDLANQISSDFKNDTEKVRAIFIWLTSNIQYDLNEFYNPKAKKIRFSYSTEKERLEKIAEIKNQIVKETLETKKGVCEGYAQTFKKLCDLLQIESKTIKGFARNSGSEIGNFSNATNHAWNVVKINNKWHLIDTTWATGYAIGNKWERHFNDYYFFPEPSTLIRSHLPEREFWQLLKNTYSKQDFFNQPLFGDSFYNKNYKLISPKSGIINYIEGSEVEFKIANLDPSTKVSYVFKGQKYGAYVNVNFENNIGVFKIPLKETHQSGVIIFFNNKFAIETKFE